MMVSNSIPCLPESAPFTPEQRAYLNGFFAGLFSRTAAPAATNAAAAPSTKPLQPLTILFGSQTGNAEALAKRVAKEAGKQGFAPTVFDLAQYPPAQLKSDQNLLLITSTFGDGEPPDNARAFWEFLASSEAPALGHVKFSVLALGDSNYAKFCECGKTFDQRFETLGAARVHPRADCDVDFEEPFQQWLNGVLPALQAGAGQTAPNAGRYEPVKETAPVAAITTTVGQSAPSYGRKNPFPAALVGNRMLNGPGSGKETRHFEFALEGSGLPYEAGDALRVTPVNCPELVTDLLTALGCTGDEGVPGKDGSEVTMYEALLRHYEVTRIPQPLLLAMAARTSDDLLKKLTAPGVNGELTKFLWGREVIDLLLAHPGVRFAPGEFVALLRKLQPRLYSISSSPKVHAGQVHLTVGVVRYDSLGRRRKGVCSTFLADRVSADHRVPVFVHSNKSFRLPPDGDRPVIMVGPGTGIAPFRGFLHERQAVGAKGKNWLFFGDQRAETDFLYRDELEALSRAGTLTRLDTAFSRDQEQKIYVQHRLLDHANEMFAWLEAGAHFYVCGDASRMAKDVDHALHQVIETASGCTAEQASEYVERLRAAKRYTRDVY